jgi:hypothetical protein
LKEESEMKKKKKKKEEEENSTGSTAMKYVLNNLKTDVEHLKKIWTQQKV